MTSSAHSDNVGPMLSSNTPVRGAAVPLTRLAPADAAVEEESFRNDLQRWSVRMITRNPWAGNTRLWQAEYQTALALWQRAHALGIPPLLRLGLLNLGLEKLDTWPVEDPSGLLTIHRLYKSGEILVSHEPPDPFDPHSPENVALDIQLGLRRDPHAPPDPAKEVVVKCPVCCDYIPVRDGLRARDHELAFNLSADFTRADIYVRVCPGARR